MGKGSSGKKKKGNNVVTTEVFSKDGRSLFGDNFGDVLTRQGAIRAGVKPQNPAGDDGYQSAGIGKNKSEGLNPKIGGHDDGEFRTKTQIGDSGGSGAQVQTGNFDAAETGNTMGKGFQVDGSGTQAGISAEVSSISAINLNPLVEMEPGVVDAVGKDGVVNAMSSAQEGTVQFAADAPENVQVTGLYETDFQNKIILSKDVGSDVENSGMTGQNIKVAGNKRGTNTYGQQVYSREEKFNGQPIAHVVGINVENSGTDFVVESGKNMGIEVNDAAQGGNLSPKNQNKNVQIRILPRGENLNSRVVSLNRDKDGNLIPVRFNKPENDVFGGRNVSLESGA